jgi:membrane-associated phospholipid phosphatase
VSLDAHHDPNQLVTLVVRSGRAMLRLPRAVLPWTARIAIVVVIVLAWHDKRALQLVIEHRGDGFASALAAFANVCGGGIAVTTLGLSAFVLGRVLHKDALAQGALVMGVAGLWCFLLTNAGQLVLAEQRPIEGGAMRFFSFAGHGISGHASATALLVLPAHEVWLRRAAPLKRTLVTALLVGWVAIVCWSRVWLGMHHVWNVLAGLALASWTSAAAVSAWRRSTNP